MQPKILVGCPTFEGMSYCLDRYINAIKNFSYSNYEILLVDNSKNNDYYNLIKSKNINVIKALHYELARDSIIESRNILRDYAIKNNFDYFLSLEQDVIPPKDIIEKLLAHNKKVVSALYYTSKTLEKVNGDKEQIRVGVAFIQLPNKNVYWLLPELIEEKKLSAVYATGLGCILIHKDILNKVKFRYEKNQSAFDDIWFSEDTKKQGYKVWLDTNIECQHLIEERSWKWDQINK